MAERNVTTSVPLILLAGGLGTRMVQWTKTTPKLLIPVHSIAFADYQLKSFARGGVTDVILSIGYKASDIRDYVGDGTRYGLRVSYVEDGPQLRGTGGAVRRCAEQHSEVDAFLITYGDSFLRVDFGEVLGELVDSKDEVLMTIYKNDNKIEPSNVIFSDGRVTVYDKNPDHHSPDMRWIDYGLLAVRRETILRDIPAGTASNLSDAQAKWSRAGKIRGLEVYKRFYQIGSPDGLAEFERYISSQAAGGGDI